MIKDLIVFTEELIAKNPACIEITEVINEARDYLDKGDFSNAKLKTEQAINACEDSISQATLPRFRKRFTELNIYLLIGILGFLLAFAMGLIYYFIRRKKFQNKRKEMYLNGLPTKGHS